MTCIACPRGCRLTVEGEGAELSVSGNRCRKGIEYGRQEALEPRRMLTTTVRTTHPEYPRLPVRLSEEVPLERLGDFMKAVCRICVETDCVPGDILSRNLLDSTVNLVATGGLSYERG